MVEGSMFFVRLELDFEFYKFLLGNGNNLLELWKFKWLRSNPFCAQFLSVFAVVPDTKITIVDI